MNHMDDCYVAELIYLYINVEQADIETVFSNYDGGLYITSII